MSSSASDRTPDLIADIGGTNARFALSDGPGSTPRAVQVLATSAYADLAGAADAYLRHAGGPRPQRAAVAIANPVTGDRVEMTNNAWRFSREATRTALGLERLELLNDFKALALSLPLLAGEALQQVGGTVPVAGTAIGLIGPGTGLGVSGLLPDGHGGWRAIEGEGGHVSFSPADALELEILRWALARHPHVSVERLVSGALGLPNLHQALAEIDGLPAEAMAAPEIVQRGTSGDCALCRRVLTVFCAMLGTAAGNLALTLGARGGVYIGGGIVPRFPEFFAASPFRARFEHRGRFTTYLQPIPCFVIHAPDAALRGAAAALD
ncbi:MAG TPA: glucokinase [Plasticicumulans sp.]|uniref:glucokinase n=2 Tax=Plasticicumulans sp. TaxID=2307179 RepID=UPI002CED2BB4|nr:glucokinase [Plasticicumulans sp.]HMW28801.1 glucokinase [Plasticicumulans sp.]HNG49386.1 glucokinase [Plasticicumulans sp.]HNI22720.1 glucokinase [Plasticicumulans sp.]HNM41927.1 glucokinase [Plasticicumulans sp.]